MLLGELRVLAIVASTGYGGEQWTKVFAFVVSIFLTFRLRGRSKSFEF